MMAQKYFLIFHYFFIIIKLTLTLEYVTLIIQKNYVRVCVCVFDNNEKRKRGHEFEKEQGGVHGRVWSKEREKEMM